MTIIFSHERGLRDLHLRILTWLINQVFLWGWQILKFLMHQLRNYLSTILLCFGGGLVGIQIEVQFYLLFLGDYNYLRLKTLAAILKPRGSNFVFLRWFTLKSIWTLIHTNIQRIPIPVPVVLLYSLSTTGFQYIYYYYSICEKNSHRPCISFNRKFIQSNQF